MMVMMMLTKTFDNSVLQHGIIFCDDGDGGGDGGHRESAWQGDWQEG